MAELKFESFEDFEGYLSNLPVDKIKSSLKLLVALFENQRKKFEDTIPEGEDPIALMSLPPETLTEMFSTFEKQMPIFQKESEAMVKCAKLLFDEEITEGKLDGKKMIEVIESIHETNLKMLDTNHHCLKFAVDPKDVIAEYEELEKQNPRPAPSNSGCMVVVLVILIFSFAAALF